MAALATIKRSNESLVHETLIALLITVLKFFPHIFRPIKSDKFDTISLDSTLILFISNKYCNSNFTTGETNISLLFNRSTTFFVRISSLPA